MCKPLIVAHRGLHGEHAGAARHPENSVAALLAAWQGGIRWCECDVRGSIEHEPFVLHDEMLGRTTEGDGPIARTRSEVLHRTGLRRADGAVAPMCVPRLSTVIAAMPGGCGLLVEIKPEVHLRAVERTLETCDPATCVIQSFDVAILHHAAVVDSRFRLELLVEDAAHPIPDAGPWRAVNAEFNSLTPEIVRAWRGRGLGVGAWTVNEDADLRRMMSLGIDTIISDRPHRALAML